MSLFAGSGLCDLISLLLTLVVLLTFLLAGLYYGCELTSAPEQITQVRQVCQTPLWVSTRQYVDNNITPMLKIVSKQLESFLAGVGFPKQ